MVKSAVNGALFSWPDLREAIEEENIRTSGQCMKSDRPLPVCRYLFRSSFKALNSPRVTVGYGIGQKKTCALEPRRTLPYLFCTHLIQDRKLVSETGHFTDTRSVSVQHSNPWLMRTSRRKTEEKNRLFQFEFVHNKSRHLSIAEDSLHVLRGLRY